jgi:hypothetical protein
MGAPGVPGSPSLCRVVRASLHCARDSEIPAKRCAAHNEFTSPGVRRKSNTGLWGGGRFATESSFVALSSRGFARKGAVGPSGIFGSGPQ